MAIATSPTQAFSSPTNTTTNTPTSQPVNAVIHSNANTTADNGAPTSPAAAAAAAAASDVSLTSLSSLAAAIPRSSLTLANDNDNDEKSPQQQQQLYAQSSGYVGVPLDNMLLDSLSEYKQQIGVLHERVQTVTAERNELWRMVEEAQSENSRLLYTSEDDRVQTEQLRARVRESEQDFEKMNDTAEATYDDLRDRCETERLSKVVAERRLEEVEAQLVEQQALLDEMTHRQATVGYVVIVVVFVAAGVSDAR